MKIPAVSCSALILTISWLLAAGTASAQTCVQPGQYFFNIQNCVPVVVTLDSSLNNIPAGTGSGSGSSFNAQFDAASSAWDTALENNFVSISLIGVGEETGDSSVIVSYAALTPNTTCARTTPTDTTDDSSAIIRINSSSLCLNSAGSGYGTIFQKLMTHELGHVFGLDDVTFPSPCSSYANLTVMGQV